MEEWQKWIECKKYGRRFFVFIYFSFLYIYAFLFAVRCGDKGVLIYTFLYFSAYCMYKERKDKMGIIQKQKCISRQEAKPNDKHNLTAYIQCVRKPYKSAKSILWR